MSPLADQGDAEAQYYLAQMYLFGFGASKDVKQTVYWYEKAAKQEDTGAHANLKRIRRFKK